MSDNIMLLTDSYKVSHWMQYPPGTEVIYSYFESRGGKFDQTVFFGLQYFTKKYLEGQVVTKEKIDEAEEMFNAHFGGPVFNRKGWEYILEKHNGYLPIRIKAVPEGTVVPGKNVLMTLENTDPNCFWLTNYLETLLVQIWYPTTVATQSREMKKVINRYLEETGDPAGIDFKLHDFGFRGVSSVETAGIGGAAHLVNFMGTDTFEGLVVARRYYGENMAGFSIPASEHSTITSWGRKKEVEAMRNMLTKYPSGLVACVSDSFDIYKACSELWGKELKDEVLARDGTLVVRPDSGDPPTVVVKCLELLWEAFGGETNTKGYRVLDPHVRMIQGDGIDFEMLERILSAMKNNKFSADNIAFGSGGGLLQKLNRDTLKFAFKCSSITVNGEESDVYKDPITAAGKKSKRGRLKLVREDGAHGSVLTTVGPDDEREDVLETVFENGNLVKETTFAEVRELAKDKTFAEALA